MIFTGNQTPYYQRQNKTSDSDSVRALILKSDAQLNTSVADYIANMTRTQTILETIHNVVRTKDADAESVVTTIKAILGFWR